MKRKSLRISQKLFGTILTLSLLTTACGNQEQGNNVTRAIPVQLTTLKTANLIDSSSYVGKLEAAQRVRLAPRIEGKILKILVSEGDRVQKGQVIAQLEPTQQAEDVNAAAANLQARKADLKTAEAELRQREAERDSASAEVTRREADLASANSQLSSREADVQDARAELELAQVNYRRSKELVEQDVRPQQDLDDKTRDLKTKEAQLQSRIKIRDSAAGAVQASQAALDAAQKNLTAASERVKAAKSNLDQAKANISQAEGELGSINENLMYNTIVAPINGVIGDFNQIKVGDFIRTGEELTTITNNDIFLLNVNIPIEYQERLKIGLPVEIVKADASPGVRGEVTYIAPLADQNAQAILTKMTFQSDGSLRDEQYVQVRVIWSEKPGLLVPTTAVTSLGGQKFVFVAEPGESKDGQTALVAKQKPVEVGSIQGQSYQVVSGIKAGEKIAVSRILDLRNNTLITEESIAEKQSVEQ
jgi:RND family efflux transporter MFP subunit